MQRVIVVGSNPSVKSPDNSPLHPSTRSRMIVDQWFRDIPCQIIPLNICNEKTTGNDSLTRKQIRMNLPDFSIRLESLNGDKIVALGKTAEWGLSQLGVEHLAMPHPSGLNRQLNDPEFVAQKIEELRKFVNG